MRKTRRGQAEIIGIIVSIPVVIAIFLAGSNLMSQDLNQMDLMNQKIRERLVVVPQFYNNTLYATIINSGNYPSSIVYILLFKVQNGSRQLAFIDPVSQQIPPGGSSQIPIFSNPPRGKYEIIVVSKLGNVFVVRAFSVPPQDTIISPGVSLSDIIGAPLAARILQNFSVVECSQAPPAVFFSDARIIISQDVWRKTYININITGTIKYRYETDRSTALISKKFLKSMNLSNDLGIQLYIYFTVWNLDHFNERSGIRFIMNFSLNYNNKKPALLIFNLAKPDYVAFPQHHYYYNIIGKITVKNGSILSYNNSKYIILLYGPGKITLQYETWKWPPMNAPLGGSWQALVEGPVSFSNIKIIYLNKK